MSASKLQTRELPPSTGANSPRSAHFFSLSTFLDFFLKQEGCPEASGVKSLLDSGKGSFLLHPGDSYLLQKEALTGASERVKSLDLLRVEETDLSSLPDSSYHGFWSVFALERSVAPKRCLREASRILAPGGRFRAAMLTLSGELPSDYSVQRRWKERGLFLFRRMELDQILDEIGWRELSQITFPLPSDLAEYLPALALGEFEENALQLRLVAGVKGDEYPA